MPVIITEIEGVECRGVVHTPQQIAAGMPKTMMGVVASRDGESHADFGDTDDGTCWLYVCNHMTQTSALIPFTRAETAQMIEAMKAVLEEPSRGTIQ